MTPSSKPHTPVFTGGEESRQQQSQMFRFRVDRPEVQPDLITSRVSKTTTTTVTCMPRSGSTTTGKKINVPIGDLIRVMILPPSLAAEKLNISVSTLKRRYWEINEGGQWPVSESGHKHDARRRPSRETNKLDLKFILNSQNNVNPRTIDEMTENILDCSFKQHNFNT